MVSSIRLLVLLLLGLTSVVAAKFCKAIPGSPDWPSPAVWQKFNETLQGRLLDPSPPAAVCHLERKEYNATACDVVTKSWNDARFHAENPISPHWNQFANDSCLPSPALPCLDEGYPEYVVNATTAEHIKLAIKFARRYNIRVIVKNTGHDYLGRSTGGYALSIWTHNIAHMSFETGVFRSKGCKACTKKQPHAILGAGSQFVNIYAFLDKYNHTIVGGSGLTVGLGGFLTGGGHGILSGSHGLGADQILEVEMITPEGELITLNECQNRDLFWAVRGGGGSTFGVITRFTVRAFPTPQLAAGLFSLSAPPNSTAAIGLGSLVLSKLPDMLDRGFTGYMWSTANGPDLVNPGGMMGGLYGVLVVEGSARTGDHEELWSPIVTEARKRWGSKEIQFTLQATAYPSLLAYMGDNRATFPSGVNKYMDTRLMSADALRNESAELFEANKCAGTRGTSDSLNVMLVSGKGLWNAKPRGGSNAVHPFWRKSAALLAVDKIFEPRSPSAHQEAIESINKCMEPLRKLEPSSGAYVNEALRYQDNWQHVFFGEHYERLLAIKRKVDPRDVFWCEACVGGERWEEVEGQLCRTSQRGRDQPWS